MEVVQTSNGPGERIRFVAFLSDGSNFNGGPSWYSDTEPVVVPEGGRKPVSDWQKLRLRCEENKLRITSLTLYVFGQRFEAPQNKAGYGYSESTVVDMAAGRSRVVGLCIYWGHGAGELVKGLRVKAEGVVEGFQIADWPECMIGEVA